MLAAVVVVVLAAAAGPAAAATPSMLRGVFAANAVTPAMPHGAAPSARSDRDRIIARYGRPDHTTRVSVPDSYRAFRYHLYITDLYRRDDLVFIYRDGKLVDKQPYARR